MAAEAALSSTVTVYEETMLGARRPAKFARVKAPWESWKAPIRMSSDGNRRKSRAKRVKGRRGRRARRRRKRAPVCSLGPSSLERPPP